MPTRRTSLQDRITAFELSQAGHSERDIARRLGWPISTVRKWRRRGQRQQGFASLMGRPSTGCLSSFSDPVCHVLETYGQAHPAWGPDTLLAQLRKDATAQGQRLPSRATIARWRHDQHYVQTYERHVPLPVPSPSAAQAPHETWEIDARGHQAVPGVGVVTLININDRVSKVKLLSYPCWVGETRLTRHPDTADYQLALRLAFLEWGLPDRLAVDRGSVYHDNRSQSPFPTQLHLWLEALGIHLLIGPPGQPTERAITERSHQTWGRQVLEGQAFASWEAVWTALEERRRFLNNDLPCASCGERPPLLACPQALTPRRPYHLEWEGQRLDLSHLWQYLSTGRWFRRGNGFGAVTLGHQLYCLGKQWASQDVEIHFDPSDRHLLFSSQGGRLSNRLPIKGITRESLLGELEPVLRLHPTQLVLPYTWHDWRVIRLYEIVSVRHSET